MTKERVTEVRAKVAEKKNSGKVAPSEGIKDLVVDTTRLKNKKTSTQILKELRYQVK